MKSKYMAGEHAYNTHTYGMKNKKPKKHEEGTMPKMSGNESSSQFQREVLKSMENAAKR